ncbi:MAG: hypothetical protein GY713_12520 [Actinomycetia bacterium]|nr:hypothetical protein [Actinomycetes bacterium]
MRDLFTILFWAWVAVSVVLLISRFMNRNRDGSTPPTAAASDPSMAGVDLDDPPMRPLDTITEPVESPAPSLDLSLGTDSPSPIPPPPPMGVDPDTDRGEKVQATAARLDSDTVDPDAKATVAELVKGITLPPDLVPLTHTSPTAADHVVFLATATEGTAVGPDIADALEKIGLTIEPISANEILASRPGMGSMHVAIHEAPHTVLRAHGPAFPTAPTGSVVVELWTGPRPE